MPFCIACASERAPEMRRACLNELHDAPLAERHLFDLTRFQTQLGCPATKNGKSNREEAVAVSWHTDCVLVESDQADWLFPAL